ncbi:catalase-like domain-containing protein [Podospora appendiculata]|uniref:Catalase-like domain-containing protein n=1 Tax=Podospora appendiculata TaxID=314037 RepID=A0AAE1CB98_9PEZI|nr:catalase-like domain-containing protein [Podospora appendiculata]
MPLPADEKTVETASAILTTLKDIFGPHPGFRPAHAKGLLLHGEFTPTPLASTLSTAPHFTSASTPLLARLSSSTGHPTLPDPDPNGNPRGLALRFLLPASPTGRRVHTDIVAHAVDAFPARTGDETLAFFSALRDGRIETYLPTHPAALAFIQIPKPSPASFSTERFFSVTAFRLVDAQGRATYIRYRILPAKGYASLTPDEAQGRDAGYLYGEVPGLLAREGGIEYILAAQVAEDGDVVDDSTVRWPESRQVVELGRVRLTSLVDGDAEVQKSVIFDPVPRVQGVEGAGDPLLDVRAGLYLLSGRERRAA